MSPMFNRKSRELLKKEREAEKFERVPVSFYRYLSIENPPSFRNDLYLAWFPLRVLGRVYVAKEGINAQLSVPVHLWDFFLETMESRSILKDTFLNRSEDHGERAFLKLDIRVREKIVADGIEENIFEISQKGTHLQPELFHKKMNSENVVVVDVRNQYECETGHFEKAILPSSKYFRDVLPELKDKLAPYKDKELLLYCTGGIRCEKASAYLRREGYSKVFQLQGGIIHYLKETRSKGQTPKFKGSMFVFDGRMAEPTVGEVIGKCHQCGAPHDVHVDCANVECHVLMIQCSDCTKRMQGCCSPRCQEVLLVKQKKDDGLQASLVST